jgi:hypothetical protein
MKYSKNIDLLVASIVYLGTSKRFWGRSPRGLADELGLEERSLLRLFEAFPTIFRKTRLKSQNGQHYYVLQARHAQREDSYEFVDVDKSKPIDPLDKDKLDLLINFVLQMTEQEKAERRAWWTTSVAAAAAVISAIAAVTVALMKTH